MKFDIGSHFVPYLMNGEATHLSDKEIDLIGSFDGFIALELGEGYWEITEESNEFGKCDVSRLRGETVSVIHHTY